MRSNLSLSVSRLGRLLLQLLPLVLQRLLQMHMAQMKILAAGTYVVIGCLFALRLSVIAVYANPFAPILPSPPQVTAATTIFLPIVYSAGSPAADAPPLRAFEYNAEGIEPPPLSSLPTATRCQSFIRFDNFSSFPALVYWQDHNGAELFYNAVESGRHYWQHTFQGNQWRVRDEAGRLIKSISAEPCENKRIELFEEDFPACGFVRRVLLWNLDEDSPLLGYDNLGATTALDLTSLPLVQLRVEVADVVESISFTVNDEQIIINDAPLAFPAINLPWELLPVTYTIKIDAYRKDNAQGRLCETRELILTGVGDNGSFTPTPTVTPTPVTTVLPGTATPTPTMTPTVTGITTPTPTSTSVSTATPTAPACSARIERLRFVNVTTGLPLAGYDPLVAGQNYDLAALPPAFALEAVVTAGMESLLFTVNGETSLEDFPPYRYPGGDIEPWRPAAGNYAVRAVAYSQDGAMGIVCDILVLNFVLSGVLPMTPTPSPTPTLFPPATATPTATNTSVPVTPTPTQTPGATGACLGDFVWRDQNSDGLQNSNESGLAAVDIYLWRDDNRDGSPDRIVRTTTTGSSGLYSLCNLDAGQYIVEFASATCIVTTPNVGSNDGRDSDAVPEWGGRTAPIVLGSSTTNNTVDAGFICPAVRSD